LEPIVCKLSLSYVCLKTFSLFVILFLSSDNETLIERSDFVRVLCLQELHQANPAAERHSYSSAKLRRLSEAAKLAVVETLHQSQTSASGNCSNDIS